MMPSALPAQPWNDAQLVRLLEMIRDLALMPYPFPDDDPRRDGGTVLALGKIAGLAGGAIAGLAKQEAGR